MGTAGNGDVEAETAVEVDVDIDIVAGIAGSIVVDGSDVSDLAGVGRAPNNRGLLYHSYHRLCRCSH